MVLCLNQSWHSSVYAPLRTNLYTKLHPLYLDGYNVLNR